MLIDTHCHLNFPDAFPNPEEAIEEALREGVERMVAIGCDLESSRAAVDLAERFEAVHAAVGVHPNYAEGYRPEQLSALARMLAHPKVAALGEIGLDFYRETASEASQIAALDDQLALAESTGKPVVFHCREAYPQLLDRLERAAPERFVLHCFAGSKEDARRAARLGAWFGVDGPITYKSAAPLREVVATLPREKLLLETDSPYMTPVPFRGKPNRPAYVRFVAAGLGATLGMEAEAVALLTSGNAKAFFGWD